MQVINVITAISNRPMPDSGISQQTGGEVTVLLAVLREPANASKSSVLQHRGQVIVSGLRICSTLTCTAIHPPGGPGGDTLLGGMGCGGLGLGCSVFKNPSKENY
jgi:hypothetical protein